MPVLMPRHKVGAEPENDTTLLESLKFTLGDEIEDGGEGDWIHLSIVGPDSFARNILALHEGDSFPKPGLRGLQGD